MPENPTDPKLIEALAALDRLREWRSADAGEVTRWEYRRRTAFAWNEMEILKEMGDEGWELCGVWAVYLYFKRPIRGREG